MKPIVSIIIPIYNAEKTLEHCVVSCLRQSLSSFEILLIDDGSTDQSFAIAERFQAQFPQHIRLFHQPNSGPSLARNIGLSNARGKYIGFLDADDRADRDMFLRLVLAAESSPADLVVCGRYDIIQEPNGTHTLKRVPHTHYPCSSIFETPELLSDTTQFVWDKLFCRDIIDAHQLRFDERFRYTEDVLFLCVYKYYCKRIRILPDLLYYHYMDERNPVRKYGNSILDVPEVLTEIYSFYHTATNFPFPDILFDLAAKRFLFRVKRFPFMGSKLLQWKFCQGMFRVMRQYFPDWKQRIISYNHAGFHGGLRFLYRGSPTLMFFYIMLPNKLKQFTLRAEVCFTKRLRCLRRYYYSLKEHISRYSSLFLNAFYQFFLTHGTVKPEQVFIQAKGGRAPAGNMFSLLLESLQYNKSIVLALKNSEQEHWNALCSTYGFHNAPIRTVQPETFRYYYHLARCAYLLNDSTFPHRFQKRSDQIYLNTWHGVPLKHMGCDVPARAYAIGDVQRNFLHADYLLFPNPFMQEVMLRSYMLDKLYRGTILQESYPRITLLTDAKRREVLRRSLGLSHMRVCCYLPTWRGLMTKKENTRQHADCMRYLSELDGLLTDDTLLYVKLHPYAERGFCPDSYRHIRPFPQEYETYDFLSVCDVLITDYSSIFFDFAFTRRKIILFAYDYEEYKTNRGLYLDPADLPFPMVRTPQDLFREIITPKYYDDTVFLTDYCPYSPSSTSEKLCRLLYKNDVTARTTKLPPSTLCLYYAGQLIPGASTFYLYYLLQQKTQEANYHMLTGIQAGSLKEYPERIKKLLSFSDFLSVDRQLFFTPAEALAYILLIKKHYNFRLLTSILQPYLDRLFSREYHRKFGTITFDKTIFCSEEDFRLYYILSTSDTAFSTITLHERNPQI